MLRLLLEFAFNDQGVDVLHCICEDYNVRSCRCGSGRDLRSPIGNRMGREASCIGD